jgi:hypothetical protein
VGEAVGPEGAIVGAAVGAFAAWVGNNGVSDLVNNAGSVAHSVASGVSDVVNSIASIF